MPSFGSGIASAVAKGLEGYVQGQEVGSRDLINEIARRQAAKRAEEDAQLRRDEFEHRKEMDLASLTTKGYTPASTTMTTEQDTPATTPPTSFKDLLSAGLGATAGPVTAPPVTVGMGSATPSDGSPTDGPPADLSLLKPITDGSLGSLPKLKVTNTPASFDPLATSAGALEGMREQARAEGRQQTLDSQEARATAANQSRELIAKLRAANSAAARGASGSRPMTQNAKETNARQAAKALLNIHGSADATKAWLASPDGQAARDQGITPFHVDLAAGLQQDADTKTAIGFSKGMKPERAVGRVRDTRAAATAAAGPQGADGKPLPPLTAAQRTRAAADPVYDAFLKSKGYP